MFYLKSNNLEIEKYTINALIYYKDYINSANSKINYLSSKLLGNTRNTFLFIISLHIYMLLISF